MAVLLTALVLSLDPHSTYLVATFYSVLIDYGLRPQGTKCWKYLNTKLFDVWISNGLDFKWFGIQMVGLCAM